LENTSDKQGDCAVLEGTNGTSAHGLCSGDVIHVLFDQTHCEREKVARGRSFGLFREDQKGKRQTLCKKKEGNRV
jgi:hypothetical protein